MLTVPHVSLGNLEIAGPGYVQHRNIDLNDGELVFNTLRLKYRNNSLWDIRDAKPWYPFPYLQASGCCTTLKICIQ